MKSSSHIDSYTSEILEEFKLSIRSSPRGPSILIFGDRVLVEARNSSTISVTSCGSGMAVSGSYSGVFCSYAGGSGS